MAGQSRALVLGGGGIAGIAWEAGVLIGLARAGVDTRAWDQVVGTSAGAIVGAKVLAEPDFDAWAERQLVEAGPEDDLTIEVMGGRVAATFLRLGRRRGLGWLPNAWLLGFGLETFVRQHARRRRPAAVEPDGRIRRFTPPVPALSRLGAFGAAARTASEATYLSVIRQFLEPIDDWPSGLVVTAIDVDTGEAVALDAASGVPFVEAVAASCAVPAFMPMVTIGGRRYMDGGMASQTHADLARGCDEVVVVAPLYLGRLSGEVEGLRRAGSRVIVVSPGPEARRVIGRSIALLDPARRARAARAGILDGRRAAEGLEASDGSRGGERPRLARSEG
jgi:NTE family protein